MPGTTPRLSERFTFGCRSRICSPSTRSIDAGTSSTDCGVRVAVTTTVSARSCASAASGTNAINPPQSLPIALARLARFILEREPDRARRARCEELLRRRARRVVRIPRPAEEIAAEQAEARIAPIEEVVDLEGKLPVARWPVARERLRHAIGSERPVHVPVVLVAARVLAVEP